MARLVIFSLVWMASAAAGVSAGEPVPRPEAPSGVTVIAQPSPPSLPVERDRVDRQRVVEQQLADGTVLAHLNGEGMERMGLVIGPDGARPVCGSALEGAIDFRHRPGRAGNERR